MFQGSIVALVTPMMANDDIDYSALKNLLDWHVESDTSGIVVAGTTGESSLLTESEIQELIRFTVQHIDHRIPVIAGTGANSTTKTIQLSQKALELGVDACLIMTPAYIKPTQEGLYLHYSTIAKAVSIPIILYNVPSRTACDLQPETVARLSQVSNIIALKEATGDDLRLQKLLEFCPEFCILSGDDATTAHWILNGAKGAISVTANIAPYAMAQMCKAALEKNSTQAMSINKTLEALHEKLFIEANPIPVKWALHQLKKIQPFIRLPLTWLSKKYHPEVLNALKKALEGFLKQGNSV